MNIDGWEIDNALLPLPPTPYLPHRLFESPTGRFAAIMYDRREIRMGTEISRLAVFEKNPFPRLVFMDPEIWWHAPLDSPVTWISDVALAGVTNPSVETCDLPFMVLDFACRRFCFIHLQRGDRYRIRAEEGVVSLSTKYGEDVSANSQRRSYAELYWFDFDRLGDFKAAYEESAVHYGVPRRSALQRIWAAAKNILGCALFIPFFLVAIADRAAKPMRHCVQWIQRSVGE